MVRTRAPLHLEVVKKCTIVDSIDSIDSRISVTKSIFAFPLASKSSGNVKGLWRKTKPSSDAWKDSSVVGHLTHL